MRSQVKIYVASSWQHPRHDEVIKVLCGNGYCVYDYRNVNAAFRWESVDPHYEDWTPEEYLLALGCLDVSEAFWKDMRALHDADVVIGLDPIGVSSALELGWAAGYGKQVILLVEKFRKPELMVKSIPHRVSSMDALMVTLDLLFSTEKKND